MIEPCEAGRRASFGGRWTLPCLTVPARHVLAFSSTVGGDVVPEAPVLHFCDDHLAQLAAAGLITEPLVSSDEWDRRTGRPLR
jgi:hypothetical protein